MENDCKSFEQYKAKFFESQRITGYGLEVTMHIPCPFCAHPDFLIHKILDTEAAYRAGATCKNCARGARGIFRHTEQGGVCAEFVQTAGEDPPAWTPYRMRRAPR
jgi:hypothetical protein